MEKPMEQYEKDWEQISVRDYRSCLCPKCHEIFGGTYAFAKHQRADENGYVYCLHPSEVNLQKSGVKWIRKFIPYGKLRNKQDVAPLGTDQSK